MGEGGVEQTSSTWDKVRQRLADGADSRDPVPIVDQSASMMSLEGSLEMGEEWRKVVAADKRTYYYCRRTRETRWRLPANAIFVRDGDEQRIFVPPTAALPPKTPHDALSAATAASAAATTGPASAAAETHPANRTRHAWTTAAEEGATPEFYEARPRRNLQETTPAASEAAVRLAVATQSRRTDGHEADWEVTPVLERSYLFSRDQARSVASGGGGGGGATCRKEGARRHEKAAAVSGMEEEDVARGAAYSAPLPLEERATARDELPPLSVCGEEGEGGFDEEQDLGSLTPPSNEAQLLRSPFPDGDPSPGKALFQVHRSASFLSDPDVSFVAADGGSDSGSVAGEAGSGPNGGGGGGVGGYEAAPADSGHASNEFGAARDREEKISLEERVAAATALGASGGGITFRHQRLHLPEEPLRSPAAFAAAAATNAAANAKAHAQSIGPGSAAGEANDKRYTAVAAAVSSVTPSVSVVDHGPRRRLFDENSPAEPNVFCPFCGECSGASLLASHLKKDCVVLERCRGGRTHRCVESAILGVCTPAASAFIANSGGGGGNLSAQQQRPTTTSVGETEQCPDCKRSFAPGRADAHRRVCRRVFFEKRPVFDGKQKRIRGTPLEYMLLAGSGGGGGGGGGVNQTYAGSGRVAAEAAVASVQLEQGQRQRQQQRQTDLINARKARSRSSSAPLGGRSGHSGGGGGGGGSGGAASRSRDESLTDESFVLAARRATMGAMSSDDSLMMQPKKSSSSSGKDDTAEEEDREGMDESLEAGDASLEQRQQLQQQAECRHQHEHEHEHVCLGDGHCSEKENHAPRSRRKSGVDSSKPRDSPAGAAALMRARRKLEPWHVGQFASTAATTMTSTDINKPAAKTPNVRHGATTASGGATSREPVFCPHCFRRFAAAAAEHHIAICAKVENRPRPPGAPVAARPRGRLAATAAVPAFAVLR